MRRFIPGFVFTIVRTSTVFIAALINRFPSRKLIVIGVTGTKGKTSTANFVADVLRATGERVAAITTANFRFPSAAWINTTKMTTPGRFALQKYLRRAVDEHCKYVVIETSSIALDQHRLTGVNFDIGIFTNLSPEHIEMHGSFENYKEAKKKLFARVAIAKKKPRVPKVSIVNVDDPVAEEFLRYPIDRIFGYSITGKSSPIGQSVIAENIATSRDGATFNLQVAERKISVQIPVVGFFNVSNALAAICVLLSQNVPLEKIAAMAAAITAVPGRMEFVKTSLPFTVIVDYAHEPKSLRSVLSEIRSWQPHRIIALIGSAGGGRDKARRPVLGQIATELADLTIITNEDPYDENPADITGQIVAGAVAAGAKSGEDFVEILDRKQAIAHALKIAQAGDVVILTGKGSEEVIMGAKGERTPWSDRGVVQELAAKMVN